MNLSEQKVNTNTNHVPSQDRDMLGQTTYEPNTDRLFSGRIFNHKSIYSLIYYSLNR